MTKSRLGSVPVWVWVTVINGLIALVAVIAIVWMRPDDVTDRPSSVATDSAQTAAAQRTASGDADPLPSSSDSAEPSEDAAKPRSTADIVGAVENGVVLLTTYNAAGTKIGIGTGFVIDSAGLVVTNFHVLQTASSADAEFHDRTKIKVTGVRAWDAAVDLAILELEQLPPSATVLTVSARKERENASDVISIGHPQAFKFSTSTGIISAIHTTGDLPRQYQRYLNARTDQVWLQTTAAIAGGSSGGPLLDHYGDVIGINTWVAGNYSFAIDARYLAAMLQGLPSSVESLADLTGPGEQLARLLREFSQKAQWFNFEYSRAPTEARRRQLLEERHPGPEYVERLYALARQHADTPTAFDCLTSICRIAAQPAAPKKCEATLDRAADRIVQEYCDDSRLTSLMWSMSGTNSLSAWKLMQRIAETSADRNLQGVACYCEGVAKQDSEAAADRASAINLLERVIREYADVVYYCGDPRHPQHVLGSEATEALFQAKNLTVGRPAMEISGADLEGTAFKLSEYRGKVVVLDFWADWCPPCMKMLPHERKLVEDFKGKPFALLGVFHESQPKLQKLVDKKAVTWRNWVEGRSGSTGKLWRISAIPTIYVLDHEGVIRHKAVGTVTASQLERWVSALVAAVPE